MTRSVVFRRIAQIEFDDAMAWYGTHRPGLDDELKDAVGSLLRRISTNPESFRKVRGEIRRAVLDRFPYSIHFLAEENRIVVMAVFHAKRNPVQLEDRS